MQINRIKVRIKEISAHTTFITFLKLVPLLSLLLVNKIKTVDK